MQLAAKNNITIDYEVGSLEELQYTHEQFDAIALIYAHFPAAIKSSLHKALDKYLRKGGIIILKRSAKPSCLPGKNENIGGPKDIESLFSTDEIRSDFANYEIIELVEKEIELNEGLYHNGKGSVIRFVGRKNKGLIIKTTPGSALLPSNTG